MTIRCSESDMVAWTEGLANGAQLDLMASVHSPDLLEHAKALLQYVGKYTIDTGAIIRPEETIPYGYWHVKFRASGRSYLDAWEYDKDWAEYHCGVDLAATYMMLQVAVCSKYGAEYCASFSHSRCVVSEGVLEGDLMEAIRYPSFHGDHGQGDSGWWISTDKYDGNSRTLKKVKLHEVTAVRPEIAPYLALPFGFSVVFGTDGEHVGFDAEIAAEEPV